MNTKSPTCEELFLYFKLKTFVSTLYPLQHFLIHMDDDKIVHIYDEVSAYICCQQSV